MTWERNRIIFISGPYRGETPHDINTNIDRARDVAEYLWEIGYGVFCPHLNSAHMDGIAPDENFLEADLEIMERTCDALVCVTGWENSEGACAEVDWARKIPIPVFKTLPTPEKLRDAFARLARKRFDDGVWGP